MSEKVTENAMYRLLRERLCKDSGNGPQAVLVPQVRSAAGFDSRRTLDAVSLGLWPSRGMLLDGYEIKTSRSDWLRELKAPAKAEEFASLVDRLWLVVADASIVKDGELPEGWGLLVRRGKQLRQTVAAERLHEDRGLPPAFSRSFLVPLLRAANNVPPEYVERLREEARKQLGWELEQAKRDLGELRETVKAFEDAAGIKIGTRGWMGTSDPARRGAAFNAALAGEEGIERLRSAARRIADSHARLAEQAREIAGAEEQVAA